MFWERITARKGTHVCYIGDVLNANGEECDSTVRERLDVHGKAFKSTHLF